MLPARIAARLRDFAANRAGNVAVVTALLLVPVLVAAGGAAVDFSRQAAARAHAQEIVDAAALDSAALAVSDQTRLQQQAQRYVDANLDTRRVRSTRPVEAQLRNGGRQVDVTFIGQTPAIFLGIFGMPQMAVSVTASTERAVDDQLEIALVLDNTWSMSDVDSRGVRKIDALKTAAENLVSTVATAGGSRVRFALVPYADYVNVGMGNRSQPWMSVPADYSTTSTSNPGPRVCRTNTTRNVCTGGVWGTCWRSVDGVRESYGCWTTPQTCRTETVAPYETCTGGGTPTTTTTWYRWYGCVASRRTGNLRLNDTQPNTPYVGLMQTSQTCLNPIVPLTTDSGTVISAIRGLIVNRGNYKPNTYIPAGMIWGVNTLSPTAPFTDGAAYDAENRQPRKVLVLMTDGENTMRFRSNDGMHEGTTNSGHLRQTDDDTAAICRYARQQGIEVYTVALAVNSTTARDMLSACATDPAHYFDAQDTTQLVNAFASIAASINRVRLTR